ncbi:MAG: hypothetical protein A2275_01075 [Bacteroidetes bacterium RIFOXYA12_FULL_35_11]|nr:MAG: hypothetical protein A2X01_20055 [Bacteroidetes bacterium GWF2_35_48]OFY77167.1 MAG: hypothetical protein A2275_01075 [Bacteroidetes bacterium RIFOXYA12_FULL_35_11]OFY93259.1 MAG: hypothetical protein A2491_16200 [Bacteroidetes bacterium RIFOXYC12_FULL_35_7]OFY97817.1 MAG: hypothetical protein A2309_13280 [Bacteroidetes bacterium RIFOXYB2_FULL_35_7]HBX50111.1 hypothetical protein [Bacteroidales bacterium]
MQLFNFIIKLLTTPPFYYWGLIALSVGLPLSEFLTSFSQFFIGGYWLLSGNFSEKWKIFKSRKEIWLIISIWFIHIIGLAWTQDFDYALRDLKIKLPLLLLPIFIGTSELLKPWQLKTILQFFIMAVIAGSLVSIFVLLGFSSREITDIRNISVFISHIRFSLFINIAIVVIVYFLQTKRFSFSQKHKFLLTLGLIWLIIFLFILKSFTGIVVFSVIAPIILFIWAYRNLKKIYLVLIMGLSLIAAIYTFRFVHEIYSEFTNIEEVDYKKLPIRTDQGNFYIHDFSNMQVENGHYIMLYICEKELKTEWEKVSNVAYYHPEKTVKQVKYNLVRYLSSRTYKKDASGVKKLTKEDIEKIEKGASNYKYYGNSFSHKIYDFFWQLDSYVNGGNPTGHTLTQRIEYFKAGWSIFKENYIIGVGTGDVKKTFEKEYNRTNSPLDSERRLRAHNQLLTFLLTFGVLGFILIIAAIFIPVITSKAYKYYIFNFAFLISFISFLNEDTLENQAGLSMFTFFYVLFVLGISDKTINKE